VVVGTDWYTTPHSQISTRARTLETSLRSSRAAMSASRPACSRALRALRAARSASASTSGRAGPSAGALADSPPETVRPARRRFSAGSGGYGNPPDFTRLRAGKPHPAFPTAPTWSTRDLLFPADATPSPGRDARGEGDEGEDFIGPEALAALARRAHLPPPRGAAAADAARGVNEVLRFVRALDHIEGVDHLEPMWSTLSEDHDAGPGRDDGGLGENGDDASADADESRAARAGWAPMRRENLLSVAPERTRRCAPHFVAATATAKKGRGEDGA